MRLGRSTGSFLGLPLEEPFDVGQQRIMQAIPIRSHFTPTIRFLH